MRRKIFLTGLNCFLVAICAVAVLHAAPTSEQKKELKAIGVEAAKVVPLISKKKFGEATKAIDILEERFSKLAGELGLKESDPSLKSVRGQLNKVRTQLTKAMEKGGSTFEKSVATVLAARCIECHGEESNSGLRLDTFEGLEKGGRTGQLIVPGDSESSLLILRLTTPDEQHRMPLGKESLSEKEILGIANWISEGANFDGDKTAKMVTLAKSAAVAKPVAVANRATKSNFAKETGSETVHFLKDLMPEMVDTCGRCHNDTDKRSGFSVMSFEKIMKGGDSGPVVVPGKLDESRIWRLVNGDDTPVMPMGNQTGITRKWYDSLKTWIEEGAKFDGTDPKQNFPSLQEREAEARLKFTPEQWLERRQKSAEEAWKKTFPNASPNRRESKQFLIFGDVPDDRLEKIEKWADAQVESLRQTFKEKDELVWRGKLAVFVFKERFGYEEFNNSIHKRETPREIVGHSNVSSTMEEVYIALQDVGDSASESSPGMRVNVIEQITSAYLKRNGQLPEWLTRGTGLAMAHQADSSNPYLASMPRLASKILQDSFTSGPETMFVEGTFSAAEVGPVGCTLVEFLLKREKQNQFGQFVQKLQSGATVDAAIKAVYRMDSKSLALAFASSLPSSAKKGKK